MKIEQLCEHFRTKTEPLRVDNVTVNTGEKEFKAHGTIWADKGAFRLRLTIYNAEVCQPGEIFTPEQFWKIDGFIDDEVAFRTSGSPNSNRRGFSDQKFNRLEFKVRSLSLGKDLNDEELNEKVAFFNENLKKFYPNSNLVAQVATIPIRISYEARLLRFPFFYRYANKSTYPLGGTRHTSGFNTFHTIIENCEVTLTQVGDDCLIRIVPQASFEIGEESLESIAHAFLRAIAFVSGKNAWPYEIKLSTPYKTLKHILKLPRDIGRSSCPLLNDTAFLKGADFGEALRCATEFFLKNKGLSDSIHKMLYLVRSATSTQTPHEIGILTICSVFEGVVDALDKCFLNGEKYEGEAVFKEAKSELMSAYENLKLNLSREDKAKKDSYERLMGPISSATFARFKQKLNRLVQHFNLPLETCFKRAFNDWRGKRNMMAHGQFEIQGGADLESLGRMAGTINVLIAAAMGYQGLAVFSALSEKDDEQYQRIKRRD